MIRTAILDRKERAREHLTRASTWTGENKHHKFSTYSFNDIRRNNLTWLQMRSNWPLKNRDRTPALSAWRTSFVTPSPSHLRQQNRTRHMHLSVRAEIDRKMQVFACRFLAAMDAGETAPRDPRHEGKHANDCSIAFLGNRCNSLIPLVRAKCQQHY